MGRLGKRAAMILFLFALAGVGAWWQRAPLMAWYYARQLSQVDERDRDDWVRRIVELDGAALAKLLPLLEKDEPRICDNARTALAALAQRWNAADARFVAMLEEMARLFPSFSPTGKIAALQLAEAMVHRATPAAASSPALQAARSMLGAADGSPGLALQALRLAEALLARSTDSTLVALARRRSLEALTAADGPTRAAAARVLTQPAFRDDPEVLAKLAPLLKDGSPEVRRNVLAALGQARELVADDDLLPLLHDADDEVAQMCEMALRGRGLSESHILLARLISAAQPASRLQVLQHLRQAPDLDAGVWLRRLCQDPVPAVRAGAVRAAAQTKVDLTDSLLFMAREDPSPTVRQLAAFYWQRTLALRNEP